LTLFIFSKKQKFLVFPSSTFTADGRNAITAQKDTPIYVWRTYNAQSLTEWVLDNRYISEWTQIECERFRIDPCELVVR
jgi:hypothetical protein